VLEKTKPDVVIACYGMNDGIYLPFAEERFVAFSNGIVRLRERVTAAGAKIIHVTPPVFDEAKGKGPGYGNTLDRYSDWMLAQRAAGWDVADLHGPMSRFLAERRKNDPSFFLAGDGVHPGDAGHWIIAKQLLLHLGANDLAGVENPKDMLRTHPNGEALLKLVQQKQRLLKDAWLTDTGHKRPGMNKGLPLAEAQAKAADLEKQIRALAKPQAAAPFPGTKSVWNGFDRYDFTVDGKPVLVVLPKIVAPGKPWVWHGEFFGHKPNPDLALLGRGFHVVYMSVPDMLGAPPAVDHWNAFYRELTEKFGFAKKAALVGLSRGGLYCYNWAAANPGKVACLYGDAPVCDFKSWPGAFGKARRSDRDWQLVLQYYGFNSDSEAKAYTKNPVDNLAPLAAAKVPLLHVFGDADEVVPWDENTGVIADRYQTLGGNIRLIRKPGVLHHPHGLDDSTPIVNFIWEHTANAEAKAWLARHGGGPLDADERPLIRKLGTIDLDMVETTPVVLNGKLWRFEWVRQGTGQQYWDNHRHTNCFRFRNPASGEVTQPFADGHEFGSAFVEGETVYVTGTLGRNRVNMFASRDLKAWESWPVIDDKRYGIFNTSITKADGEFVLAFEIDKPREEAGTPFTIRFTKSRDLRSWRISPPECNFTKERYSAAPCLRWSDGWFYLFYLEAHQGYETRVVRSRELVKWDASPLNPVLCAPSSDKQIANPKLTAEQQGKIAAAKNINNSDLDFCEWQGRLVLNYSWGNQQGTEFLAEAVYDGTEKQFLHGWFPGE
jgi:pimeloyl-ACP methyl ester carboxylesterase